MDGPTLINNIERIDRLHSLIRHDLRDSGIKLPKSKKVKKQNQSRRSISLSSQNSQEGVIGNKIFGQHLSQIPCVFLEQYGYVPQFLITTGEFVINHSESEGIFRKSGSVGRQKELRVAVEDGKPLEEANIHDVTSLIKQFFRELPEPLIIPIYHDAFIKSFQLPAEKDPKEALLRLCLLLPLENLGTLRYTMHLLQRVSQRSEKNKMTCNNLALVIAPNLMGGGAGPKNNQKMTGAEEKVLHIQTCIVEFLIKHWEHVAVVPAPLRHQLNMMSECFATDDDLDMSDDNTLDEGKETVRKKKRRRSGSLTGIVSSIAQGIAKLRRSTDGKSVNMSSNSTFRGELSLASDYSNLSQTQDYSVNETTPYIMRKRRNSGEAGPFTSSKKQAILGNLPQKSALASTPFTPASTLKRDQYPQKGNQKLNATTPIMGTKMSRKKLNLFTSPGSSKKMKRQTSASERLESPPAKPGKGRNMFRRKSGSRDKHHCDDSVLSAGHLRESLHHHANASPKSAVSDSALHEAGRKKEPFRSASSTSLQDSESSLVIVDDETDGSTDCVFYPDQKAIEVARFSRSKSVDSPGVKRGQPNAVSNGLGREGAPRIRGRLDKSLISDPSPLVVPVVTNAVDCIRDGELRRSRRDEFEREQRKLRENVQSKNKGGISDRLDECIKSVPLPIPDADLDKSVSSHLDASLMEAVLPPPHGFGDQTMLEGDIYNVEKVSGKESSEEEEIDVELDVHSEAGFSTISGGTVMQRTDSGYYTFQDHHSVSGSVLVGSYSSTKSSRPFSMSADLPCNSLLKSCDNLSASKVSKSEQCLPTIAVSGDKTTPPEQCILNEDPYVILKADASNISSVMPEGEYVVLRHKKSEKQSATESSKGLKLLCENYHSSEEDSSSSTANSHPELNITVGSHQDDLDKMPTQADVTKRKSLSAEDLQTRAKFTAPSRAQSLYMGSPGRKFNYKPHLEIRRETHSILARAGYMESSSSTDKSKDIQIPVKSPTRSSYREEMRSFLKSSFYERPNRLSASLRSHRNHSSMDASLASLTADTSISSGCERLSISSQNDIKSASGDASSKIEDCQDLKDLPVTSELMQKVEQISATLDVDNKQRIDPLDEIKDKNVNTNCLSKTQKNFNKELPTVDSCDSPPQSDTEISKDGIEDAPVVIKCDKPKNLKENDKLLTLSGFLDKKIASQMQIKRAELLIPKHNSILDVKQAGIVAQSVRHFSQHHKRDECNRSLTSTQRRGHQAVRIPTIFAKTDERQRYYREITNVERERLGRDESPREHGVSTSQKTRNESIEEDEGDSLMSETSQLEDGNLTVLEVQGNESLKMMLDSPGRAEKTPSPMKQNFSDPSLSSSKRPTFSSCECASNSNTQSPKKGALQSASVSKSPLSESTNTAPTVTTPKLSTEISEALALCSASGEVLTGLSACRKLNPRPYTPGNRGYSRTQLKRLKGLSSTRKQMLSSPVKSPKPQIVDGESSQGQKLSTVIANLEDDLHV